MCIPESRYIRILDNMTEGCQIISPEWRYINVNAAAAAHGSKRTGNDPAGGRRAGDFENDKENDRDVGLPNSDGPDTGRGHSNCKEI